MQETKNYKFIKPDINDNVNINDINKNMDMIDEEIKKTVDSMTGKVDKEEGKTLSTNDFTNTDKSKLDGIQAGAEGNRPISDSVTSDDSTTSASSKAVKIAYEKACEKIVDLDILKETDLKLSLEILEIKMKLKERELADFISKTGMGYYNVFTSKDDIDIIQTTANVNNYKKIIFSNNVVWDKLKLKSQTFESFNNMELDLYPVDNNDIIVLKDVTNVNQFNIDYDKELDINSKLWIDNSEISFSNLVKLDKRHKKLNNDNSYYMSVQGDWIYYSNESDGKHLYKIKIDGTGRTALNSDVSYNIQVQDDWIYYRNNSDYDRLYKIKTDGTERTKLNNDEGFELYEIFVKGDWIYYRNRRYNNYLYKIRTDGTEKTSLNIDSPYNIKVQDDWVYYRNDSGGNNLYKIKTDGTENIRLNSDISYNIQVQDDWVYYSNGSDNDYLYKIKTDGTERTRLNSDDCRFIQVQDDWIYYSNSSDHDYLYKIKTDGTERTKLNSDESSFIFVQDDWVYYGNNEDDGHLYKILVSGTYKLTTSKPLTLKKNQKIPVISFKAEQNNTPLQLNYIDKEKYNFSINNLNTTNTADITIKGNQIELDSLVYAVE